MSDIVNSIFNADYISANISIQERLNLKLARLIGSMEPAFSQARYSLDESVINPIDLYQYHRNEHLEDIKKNNLMESIMINNDAHAAIANNRYVVEMLLESDIKKKINENGTTHVRPPAQGRNPPQSSHWPVGSMTDSQKSNFTNYLKNKEEIERENPSSVWSQLPAEIGKEIAHVATDPVELGTLAASAALVAAPIPGTETAGAALNAWRMVNRADKIKKGVKAATAITGVKMADHLRTRETADPLGDALADLPLPMPPETAAEQAANAAAAAAAATTGGGGGGGGGSNGEPPNWWERGKIVRPLARWAFRHRYPLIGMGALGAGAAATEYLRRAGNAAGGVEETKRLINQNNPSTRPDRWNNGSSDNTNRHAGTKRSQQDRNR